MGDRESDAGSALEETEAFFFVPPISPIITSTAIDPKTSFKILLIPPLYHFRKTTPF
jgi:hypothetical protein